MGDVAGMKHKGGLLRQRLDLADRLFERVDGMRVCGLVETDVAVGDVKERKAIGGDVGDLGRLGTVE
jgi:hypothetical protein